jgi:hypothetical protein
LKIQLPIGFDIIFFFTVRQCLSNDIRLLCILIDHNGTWIFYSFVLGLGTDGGSNGRESKTGAL